MSRPSRLSLKFLVSNGLAGTLIGTGGAAIKELMEVTEARVTVSGITDVYPGTSERIVLISGTPSSVDSAQSLIWEMFGSNVHANGEKTVSWSPRIAQEAQGEFDDVQVNGKISIPATAGGLVLGRGGATFRAIAEESGARVQMSSKEEAMFTQERIITISGTVDVCLKCTSLIISKLAEDLEAAQYVNRGVSYTSHLSNMMGGAAGIPMAGHMIYPQPTADPRFRSNGGRGGAGRPVAASAAVAGTAAPVAGADISASTEITINVPDLLVGNILGRQGATMREIMSLSGAKVVVSARGTFAEGTSNRIVTISGAPANAHTAHMLVTQKLQQQSTAPRAPRRPKTAGEA